MVPVEARETCNAAPTNKYRVRQVAGENLKLEGGVGYEHARGY